MIMLLFASLLVLCMLSTCACLIVSLLFDDCDNNC
jgi:hypothetical protein